MIELLPAASLVFVAAITPGPNNVIVMRASAQGGGRAAARAIAGVIVGSLVLLAIAWSGLAALLATDPRARAAVTLLGAAYLVWMGAAMIMRAGKKTAEQGRGLPNTVGAVAAFQLVNPKAWLLVLGATAATMAVHERLASGALETAVGLAVVVVVITSVCLLAWALAGIMLNRWLDRPGQRKTFDRAAGALLVASAALLLR